MLEAVVTGHGDGESEAAGFEAAGGVGSFFFDVEAGVALAVEERRPAFAEGDGLNARQDCAVAPHSGRRPFWIRIADGVANLRARCLRQVAADVECSRALVAYSLRG